MAANGKISTSNLARLPKSWSNRGRDEFLTKAAYASLSRMIARAVAETGANFQIYDAYRSYEEQVGFFTERYYRVTFGADKRWNGKGYKLKKGWPKAAVPGTSNHGVGVSIDIHPDSIQRWLKSNARRYGWVNDVTSEPWHWSYLRPDLDQYKSEGALDHAWVQKVVGAKVDGKIGSGTVGKIKEWQKANGLEVDGKVGPNTKKKMLGGATDTAENIADNVESSTELTTSESNGFTYSYARVDWDTQGVASGVHPYDGDVAGIYIHYPGSPGNMAGDTIKQTISRLRGYRAMHINDRKWKDFSYSVAVDHRGFTYEGRGLGMETGANGGSNSNNEAGAILLLVGNNEAPSAEMISAANGLLAQYKKKFSGATYIRGHRQSPDASTSCPGDTVMSLLEAGKFSYDGSAYAVESPDVVAEVVDGKLEEDGRWGTSTSEEVQSRIGANPDGRMGPESWSELQKIFVTPVDGKVSNQSYAHDALGNGISPNGWEYTGPGSSGSTLIKALQKAVGAEVDGVLYEGTTRLLQKKLNDDPNFLTSPVSSSGSAQKSADIDGRFGTGTVKAGQRFLNSRGANLKVDGKAGHNFWSELQKYLGTPVDGKVSNQSHRSDELGNGVTQGWEYTGPGSSGSAMVRALQKWVGVTADGVWGEKTTAALQRKLVAHGYAV